MKKSDRPSDRWLFRKLLWIVALLSLAACAGKPADDGRLLTKDQDKAAAEMMSECGQAGGCTVVPVPLMQKLMLSLRACHEGHSL